MRLDKFLKISRIIKRRTIAKEVIDLNKVYVNDQLAKPSKEVKVGDMIKVQLGNKELIVRILSLPNTVTKQNTSEMYEIISMTVLKSYLPS